MSDHPLRAASWWRAETARQFLRFGLIGTAGFVVDSGVLRLTHELLNLDRYSGRLLSWFAAATFTWAMNRHFTFADHSPPLRQWLAFLSANAIGGVVNLGVYYALVTFVAAIAETPTLGVAAGSIAGLFFNFTASKIVVFRRARRRPV
jgi:putative flippase GtrA